MRVKWSQRWSRASCWSSSAVREPAVVVIVRDVIPSERGTLWLGGEPPGSASAPAERLRDALDLAGDDLALDLVHLVDVLDRDERAHLSEADTLVLEPVRHVAAALPLAV